ncbi:MAG: hypothetical protein M0D57_08475 [Sphingobacteriales bacterium JAD_PAG50586_3]|nr:MAG: hypothetical protein M0D57_08475 [Sphingobacteriales bacterium JAD_PAG50586_3]
MPFTEQTLDCLFTQVSSKTLKEKKLDREEADPVGQYGTGFMTSHAFGDIIKVSGAILDEDNIDGELSESHIDFNDFVIDRSTQDWEKLSDDIRNLRINVEELLKSPASTKEFPPTVFPFNWQQSKINNVLLKPLTRLGQFYHM